jgi:hypothetical protein
MGGGLAPTVTTAPHNRVRAQEATALGGGGFVAGVVRRGRRGVAVGSILGARLRTGIARG